MKNIVSSCLLMMAFYSVFAQQGWQNQDLQKDNVFGISTEKAYTLLLKKRKSTAIVVAVIDSGIDTTHLDLKSVLWTNSKEKDNGIDDDSNGYSDDLHGWNFIGGRRGDVNYDNLELTRIMRRDNSFYDSLSYVRVPDQYQSKYQTYRSMKREFIQQVETAQSNADEADKVKGTLNTILHNLGISNPVMKDFVNYQASNENEQKVKDLVIGQLTNDPDIHHYQKQLEDFYSFYKGQIDYQLNLKYDPRPIVEDNYANSEEENYGNNDVNGPNALHGTHVAGIIAAKRNNGIGIDGVADNVKLMIIRVVPDGDERDKDVANAIRYAVNNGARIINMSFGKAYQWDKPAVDKAVKYAMEKDVLLIHAAGNDGKDLDNPKNTFFPTSYYSDSEEAKAWITVGASGIKDNSNLAASFSNYGKTKVDIFAPGVQIYSCIPGSAYQYEQGTSMAAPVVSGVAALIREYYPMLTAIQVKEIIMKSVIKRNVLKDKCVSSGIVNAYNALKLAATYPRPVKGRK